MYELVNHNLRNYFGFVFLVSDFFGALYGESYVHNGSVTHLFRRSIVGKKFLFPSFSQMTKRVPRGICGFLLTGAFPRYIQFAAVDAAVIPAGYKSFEGCWMFVS